MDESLRLLTGRWAWTQEIFRPVMNALEILRCLDVFSKLQEVAQLLYKHRTHLGGRREKELLSIVRPWRLPTPVQLCVPPGVSHARRELPLAPLPS